MDRRRDQALMADAGVSAAETSAPELSRAAAMSQVSSAGRMLKPDQIDDLGRAVLHLARELWVVRDRQRVLEAVLGERGIDVAQAVADYQPAGALAEEIARDRDRFAAALVEALCPEDQR